MREVTYSIWSEFIDRQVWFWIVDEIDGDNEKVIAAGIENSEQDAMREINKYL